MRISSLLSVGLFAGVSTIAVSSGAEQVPTVQVTPMPVRIVEDPMPIRKNRMSFGPLGLLLGIGNFTYERAVSKRLALEVSPVFFYWGFDGHKIYGGGATVGGSVYLTGNAPQGLRLNVSAGPGGVAVAGESVLIVASKATFGYNWVWRSGFTMGLAGGAQYVYMSNGKKSAFNGLLPAVDFNLGFVF